MIFMSDFMKYLLSAHELCIHHQIGQIGAVDVHVEGISVNVQNMTLKDGKYENNESDGQK